MNTRTCFATIAIAFAVAASACGAGTNELADTPPTVDQTGTETVEVADVAAPQLVVDAQADATVEEQIKPTPNAADEDVTEPVDSGESPASLVVIQEPTEVESQPIVEAPATGPVGGALDPSIPWLSASEDGVFVAGLTSQAIEDGTGLAPGVIVVEDNPNAPGPTLRSDRAR